MSKALTVILGSAGKTGLRVRNLLETRKLPVRLASRSTDIRFDWGNPDTWPRALDGASRAYVASPGAATKGAAQAVAELGRMAHERGLERVVMLSVRGDPAARSAEEGLRASGASWTILRAGWLSQVFSEGYLADGVRRGDVALPAGSVPEPFVDADDVAYVAAAALTNARHANTAYEVTGPGPLSFAEATAEIAAATGRPLRYREISPEEFLVRMRRAGVPPRVSTLLNERFASMRDGRSAKVAHGIEAALNRSPCDFASYARRTAVSGVWSPVTRTVVAIANTGAAPRHHDMTSPERAMSRAVLAFAYRKA